MTTPDPAIPARLGTPEDDVTSTHPARTGPALTEAVDPVAGTVRVSGHLSVQGADLVRGTVENLCRLGHSRIVLDLAAVQTADDGALPVLQALRDGAARGRVVLLGAALSPLGPRHP
jgi:hypothetical protein